MRKRFRTIFIPSKSLRKCVSGFEKAEFPRFQLRDRPVESGITKCVKSVARRGTCLKRNYGAVIEKNDEIISTGYTEAPKGAKNCTDIGYCPRANLNVPPGERYELCRSVHAEMNTLIHVSRREAMSGTMYLMGIEAQTGGPLPYGAEPCRLCKRVIINPCLKGC